MLRICLNHPDWFCFVCGKFTSKEQQRNITHDIKKTYMIYFVCPLGNQDKIWHLIKFTRNAIFRFAQLAQ